MRAIPDSESLVPSIAGSLPHPPGYERRCAAALEEALAGVPAYSSWREADPGPGVPPWIRLAQMPVLRKADLRACGPQAFVPGGRDLRQGLAEGIVDLVETSGSTGERVVNAWYQPWWDSSERSSWALNAHAESGGLGAHREAILTSPYSVGVVSEDVYLDIEERRLGRFLYLNERGDPGAWTQAHMERMIGEINTFRPKVLEANPSFLARLARYAQAQGRRLEQPRLIVLTYENPSLLHYRAIRSVFSSPIASSYGCTEAGYVLMECEAGRWHQNTDSCHIDFLPFREEYGGPVLGRLLVTTLDNPWRSLLRFDPGDVVRLDGGSPCPCGRRHGLTIASIEGRIISLTQGPAGKVVTPAELDRSLSRIQGLLEYQLLQTDGDAYQLRYVADAGCDGALGREAGRTLKELYGAAASIETVEAGAINPEPSGKYRRIKTHIPIDADSLLDPRYLPPPRRWL